MTKEEFTQEFTAAFQQILNFVKKFEDQNRAEFSALKEAFTGLSEKIKNDHASVSDELKSQINEFISNSLNNINSAYQKKIQEIDERLSLISDGKDADEDVIVEKVLKKIKIPTVDELKNDIPSLAVQIRDALEVLDGEDKIKMDAIAGLNELLEDIKKQSVTKIIGGGGNRHIDQLANVNTAGKSNGNTLVWDATNKYWKAGSVSGVGYSILAATGNVDNTNTTFTFASEPVLVVVNGATYRDGHGCSISGTTVTLDNPVGTGGDIYGLG